MDTVARAAAVGGAEPRASRAARLAHVPGSGGWPLVGTSVEFLRDPFAFHERRAARHGPVYKTRSFGRWAVALVGADALEAVLMDRERNFSSEKGWSLLADMFGGGLMLRDFDDHRLHRRIMQAAAFKPKAMADYVDRMNGGIAAALARWPAGRARFYDRVKALTLELGAAIFMGLDAGAEARRLNRAFVAELAATVAVVRAPLPGNAAWRGRRARAFLLGRFRDLIPARRAGGGEDLFSQLCRARFDDGRALSDGEIVDHLNFLLMAAHDTTTSGLATMAWALAAHPRWQEAAREEIAGIGAERLDHAMMDRLPLTERVFKEALRLKPPVPFVPRYALRPFAFGGHEIPGETHVSVSPGLAARDPALWTDPLAFDPDRFLPGRAEDKSHRFAWAPFGGGAHKCIGLHFAMMQAKAFAFQFLRRFRLSLPPGYRPRWRVMPIPKPADGLPLVVEPV